MWAVAFNLFLIPRTDVDTYHDGYIYPIALMTSKGWIPNREIISIYGPLGPTIQGFWLRVTEPSVLALRIHGAFLIIVIGLLLLRLLRPYLGIPTSILVVSWWLIGNPLLMHPSLPWVDLYTTLIMLLIIWLTTKRGFLTNKTAFLMGVLSFIGIMAKINFGLTVVLIAVYLISSRRYEVLRFFLMGCSLCALCVACLMYLSGSLNGYIQQTIFYSWTMHDQNKPIRGLLNLKIFLFGFLIVFIYKIAISVLIRNQKRSSGLTNLISIVLSLIAIFVAIRYRRISVPFVSLSGNPHQDILNLLKNAPYALLFGIIAISFLSNFLARKKLLLSDKDRFITSVAMIYMIQLYPNPEPGHIWYVIPVVAVSLAPAIAQLLNRQNMKLGTALVLVPTIAALTTINLQLLSIERFQYKKIPLKGMIGTQVSTEAIDGILEMLEVSVSDVKIQNNCARGIYSVPRNEYIASDYQHQSFDYNFYLEKKAAPLTLECDLDPIRANELQRDFKVIFKVKGELPRSTTILYSKGN
jgi:hypothetical protein